jgi:hypothetical protein
MATDAEKLQQHRKALDEKIETLAKAIDHSMACAIDVTSHDVPPEPWSGALVEAIKRVQSEVRWFRGCVERRRADLDARAKEGTDR